MVYRQTAAKLSVRTGRAPTYIMHTDEEGWESLRAIWQLTDGYAELCIGSANDNDYMHLLIGPGRRPAYPDKKPSSPSAMSSIFAR